MSAGYSQRSLAQKLGIKAGWTIAVLNAPENYLELLAGLPDGVTICSELGCSELSSDLPLIHFFCTKQKELEEIGKSPHRPGRKYHSQPWIG